ncbi:MAG TPA: DUF6788 family protein [Candidatus Saccharimonadales bacterium]|nr:DUF6788 family protein [Candidatus Saccharimonadales bacterium]
MKSKQQQKSAEFPASYRQLQKQLAGTGWIALGSLLERGQPGQGGPRYQWSRRVGGKTVTVALSAEQFEWLGKAIANQRQAWDIMMKMQRLTVETMLEKMPNPSRRKPLTRKQLGLN